MNIGVQAIFPNQQDLSVTQLSMRAHKFGPMLILGRKAPLQVFDVTKEQVRSMFDELYRINAERAMSDEHPFPHQFDLVTRQGTFSVDSEIAEGLCTALFQTIIDQDLGQDLLDEYRPE